MDNINTSRLSLEELFRLYPMVMTGDLEYSIATKTKPIRAKHISCLLVDKSVLTKFLIEALEGKEPLSGNSVICLGDAGDIWQQAPNKLLGKYSVSEITEDGWMVCQPKDGNECLVYKSIPSYDESSLGFSIVGLYGEARELDGQKVHLQFGLHGDYILGSKEDKNDRWIVRASLFEQTYEIKAAMDAKIIKINTGS